MKPLHESESLKVIMSIIKKKISRTKLNYVQIPY